MVSRRRLKPPSTRIRQNSIQIICTRRTRVQYPGFLTIIQSCTADFGLFDHSLTSLCVRRCRGRHGYDLLLFVRSVCLCVYVSLLSACMYKYMHACTWSSRGIRRYDQSLCMLVYVCECAVMYVQKTVFLYIYVYVYACIHAYTSLVYSGFFNTKANIHVYIYIYIYIINTHAIHRLHVCMYIYIYIYVYIFTPTQYID
jgi:hypothetical protein